MTALVVLYVLLMVAGGVWFGLFLRKDARQRRRIRELERRINEARRMT